MGLDKLKFFKAITQDLIVSYVDLQLMLKEKQNFLLNIIGLKRDQYTDEYEIG